MFFLEISDLIFVLTVGITPGLARPQTLDMDVRQARFAGHGLVSFNKRLHMLVNLLPTSKALQVVTYVYWG